MVYGISFQQGRRESVVLKWRPCIKKIGEFHNLPFWTTCVVNAVVDFVMYCYEREGVPDDSIFRNWMIPRRRLACIKRLFDDRWNDRWAGRSRNTALQVIYSRVVNVQVICLHIAAAHSQIALVFLGRVLLDFYSRKVILRTVIKLPTGVVWMAR